MNKLAVQTQPSIQSYMHNRAATGWNDPPPFTPVVRSTKTNSTIMQNEAHQFFQPNTAVPTLPNNVNNLQMQNSVFNSNSLPGGQNMHFKNTQQNLGNKS